MCGLVGVITKTRNGFTAEQKDIFGTLMFIDTMRGPDSTGAFTISNSGDVAVAKEASDAFRFLKSKEYSNIAQKAWTQGAAMIGHNRKATRGTINDDNAHPFNVDDNIILVHNGTMWGDHKKHADVEVDSHAIAHLIHENNDDVAKALSSFQGAYALIWYDIKKATLSMIRNSERPLWWMETSNAWIWSSEEEMLDFIAAKFRLTLKTPPTPLPEHTLQEYKLGPNGWDVSAEKLEIKQPSYKVWPSSSSFQTSSSANHRHANAYDHGDGDFNDELDFQAHWRNHNRGSRNVLQLPSRKVEPTERAGLVDRERTLCKRNNKIVTHAEYAHILASYGYGVSVLVCPFDYEPYDVDSEGGWYLYATPLDDQSVVFRKYFPPTTTEETMIQFAGLGHVFEFEVGIKSWTSFAPIKGEISNTEEGFAIIRSEKATMITRAMNELTH